MSQRGSLSIIACLLLLHVQVGAAIQYCANASSSAYSDSTPASANLHLHHGGGSDSPAQSDGSTPKGHCASWRRAQWFSRWMAISVLPQRVSITSAIVRRA